MAEATTVFYAVDRIEGRLAVLVADDGRSVELVRRDLPKGVREGAVLRVRVGAGGVPDWRAAVVDQAEGKRRVEQAKAALEALRRTDPGGDVAL